MLSSSDIWQHLDGLTKPPRSLGRLEELAERLCLIQQALRPVTQPRRLVLFAGDHGVVASGVTAWPAAVTQLMLRNIAGGGAASSVLARQTNTELVLVNVGALGENVVSTEPVAAGVRYRHAPVRQGSRDLFCEPALTVDEFEQALQLGRDEAEQAAREGMRVVLAGEMGIGNTTPAACLTALVTGLSPAEMVGRGAGADDAILEQKRKVVAHAVARSRENFGHDQRAALAGVCGYEIAAMAGFYLGAWEQRLPVLLDGYVATAGALIAHTLEPRVTDVLIAAHLSAEPGHVAALKHLHLSPFLEWEMRLGEGTGALALLSLLDAAAAIAGQMATLADLGIGKEPAT